MPSRLPTCSLCLAAGLLAAESAPLSLASVSDGPKWTYGVPADDSAELGPKDWALGYPSCAGSSQSPIDLTAADASDAAVAKGVTVPPAPLLFEGDCYNFLLHPGEHAFKWLSRDVGACQVRVQGGGDAAAYSLSRFQIRSPAEHTVNGHAYDAELQFVHALNGELEDAESLVVSLFVEAHHTSSELVPDGWMSGVWESMRYVNESVAVNGSYADLLLQRMQMGDVYSYRGSLSAPPCTQEATWWVVRTPLYVPQVDLDTFHEMLGELAGTDAGKNARETQPRNGRPVKTFRGVVDQEDSEDADEDDGGSEAEGDSQGGDSSASLQEGSGEEEDYSVEGESASQDEDGSQVEDDGSEDYSLEEDSLEDDSLEDNSLEEGDATSGEESADSSLRSEV